MDRRTGTNVMAWVNGTWSGGRPQRSLQQTEEQRMWEQLDRRRAPGTAHEIKYPDNKEIIVLHIDKKTDLIIGG